MKKRHRHLWLKVTFWSFVVAAGLWVAFAPTKPVQRAASVDVAVQVKTDLSPEKPEGVALPPAPVGDEQAQPVVTEPPPMSEVAQPPRGHPVISIVIDDMGLNLAGSMRAVALPATVTLSYIPYASRLGEQTRVAREAGHELLLHMPMEPIGNADPGQGALLVDLPPEEIRQRFQEALASFIGFDGVNNHMGSKFTTYRPGMEIVMDELAARHLFFLDSRTIAQSIGAAVAEEHHLPHLSRDVFLDDDINPKSIRLQLAQVEKIARARGHVIAIGHPHEATLQALEEWLPDAAARGFTLVPLHDQLAIR